MTSTAASWDPQQYGRFAAERAQPFWDLAALVGAPAAGASARLVDLGCGTGELTAALVDRLGVAEAVGVDFAGAMLERAAAHAGPRLRFVEGDLAAFEEPGAWDVVLANASLQWVPDHPAVLARWARSLRPGGALAVQVPANADHPSHLVAAETAASPVFRDAFGPVGPPADTVAANVLAPERYAEVLHGLGLRDVHVRLQVYLHELDATAEVVEWVKGTTLNRFRARLDAATFDRFVVAYRDALLDRVGDRRPYLYPFKRILFRAIAP